MVLSNPYKSCLSTSIRGNDFSRNKIMTRRDGDYLGSKLYENLRWTVWALILSFCALSREGT